MTDQDLSKYESKDEPGLLVVPDATEPVLAYRHWKLMRTDLVPPMHTGRGYQRLNSLWKPGESVAWCDVSQASSDHCKVGYGYCSCGFYGVWNDDHDYARQTNYNSEIVFGVIACYGRIRLGEQGLRAGRANIVALHLPPVNKYTPNYTNLMTLMRAYGEKGTKFYKHRDNLVNGLQVHKPKDLIYGQHFG